MHMINELVRLSSNRFGGDRYARDTIVSSGCFSGVSNCVVWVFLRSQELCRLGVINCFLLCQYFSLDTGNIPFSVLCKKEIFFKILTQSFFVV